MSAILRLVLILALSGVASQARAEAPNFDDAFLRRYIGDIDGANPSVGRPLLGQCNDCIFGEPKFEKLIGQFVFTGCGNRTAPGKVDPALRATCVKLARELATLGCDAHSVRTAYEQRDWMRFLDAFKGPCSPIPKKYFDSKSIFLGNLLRRLAPVVVSHPGEKYPPRDLYSILLEYSAAKPPFEFNDGNKRVYYTHSDELDDAAKDSDHPKSACKGRSLPSGECCGELNAPLYTDIRSEPGDGISVSFSTVHSYGTYENSPAGTHTLDTESVQYKYDLAPDGTYRLKSFVFSRHGLATEEVPACVDGKYQFHSSVGPLVERPSNTIAVDGTVHPVFFAAKGGHAMYPSSDYPRGSWTPMRTDSPLERTADSQSVSNPLTGLEKLDLGTSEYAFHSRKACVSFTNPENVHGTGSLWHDSTFGAAGRRLDPVDDICVEYRQYDEGAANWRSLRYLGWIGGSADDFKRFGCGEVAGAHH